jgi:hypothetical protein
MTIAQTIIIDNKNNVDMLLFKCNENCRSVFRDLDFNTVTYKFKDNSMVIFYREDNTASWY